MTELSFVIPTYNGSSTLPACLHALERERKAGNIFEVIVVDDGSTDSTFTTLEALQTEVGFPLRILHQENLGPGAARNRGIKAACGKLIGFLGDDIVVSEGYVRRMCQAYDSFGGELHAVLGRTRYSPDSVPSPFGRWINDGDMQFAYSEAVPGQPLPFGLFYTSNVVVPLQALLDVGGFNAGLRYAAYEDTELGYRLAQRGLKLYYCPGAEAAHLHPVSVRAYAQRMSMSAQALNALRSVNPELFAVLYPDAELRFGTPSVLRKTVRTLRATLLVRALDLIDTRVPWRLPDFLYRGAMKSTFSREMSRLWADDVAC